MDNRTKKVLVIASKNEKKSKEMKDILESLLGGDWEIKTLMDYPQYEEPEEISDSYAENARIKAETAMRETGEMCIADDAGLEIDALGGKPGVHSKRFAGEETPFPEKIRQILEMLRDVPEEKRTARFRCFVAIASPGMETRIFEASKEGKIAFEPRGSYGFGYDPIFYLPEYGKTYAEMLPEEKNRISHRFLVLKKTAEWLNTSVSVES
ncbi:MAG TPA: RdgB/HAM1 family non-canonical purine NTP pyrophosphatase [Fimbriimonadales bacterium]|nr:RdgB/HAM1 family non-canonical purine NTP pyrophosphatase [Fimbriimonadales bacterium]